MAEQSTQEMELKEKVDSKRFTELLTQVCDAIGGNRDFQVTVQGEEHTVPARAFAEGNYRVEYEIEKGEGELEFTLKWKC